MTSPWTIKTAQHLMHIIVTRTGDVPNFSVFLGSGASVTSGIRTATDMIDEWRHLLFRRSSTSESYEAWLANQAWYDSDDEYSILFETIYDQPPQRRVYIEEAVNPGHPSWGYVYLTNFLANRLFDVVFTTNFDDLLNEACYLYTDGLRPIVAAHDSAIQGIRVTSGRPKIIKLHGDFLYDSIKNTLSELETLESNTKNKLSQFAKEYGLVVLGYSGRDKSVMDTLDLLLRDDDNYRQGVYWCHRKGTPLSSRLEALLRRDRVYLVEIEGFDEFAADLHNEAGLALPGPIARPFEMARHRARLFVDVQSHLKEHSIIGADIQHLLSGLDSHRPVLPLSMEAATLSARGEQQRALAVWESAYKEDPDDVSISYNYAEALASAEEYEKLAEFVTQSANTVANKAYFLLHAGKNERVVELTTEAIKQSTRSEQRPEFDVGYTRINRAIALKRLGRRSEMERDLRYLQRQGHTKEPALKAGVAALRGEKQEMLAAIRKALPDNLGQKQLLEFPVFEDYKDDPEFCQIIADANLEETLSPD